MSSPQQQRSRFTPGDRIVYNGTARTKNGETGTIVRFSGVSRWGGSWEVRWDNPKFDKYMTYSADYMTVVDDSKDFEFDV